MRQNSGQQKFSCKNWATLKTLLAMGGQGGDLLAILGQVAPMVAPVTKIKEKPLKNWFSCLMIITTAEKMSYF